MVGLNLTNSRVGTPNREQRTVSAESPPPPAAAAGINEIYSWAVFAISLSRSEASASDYRE
jgi:hypothetical protein